ncbi:hypothetical protein AAFF_G00083500 [Aldrovandia affinis]|uniref:Uncharacterized protein n=1 Tax=Aldrovandia affinis TaxID=143900 RepID=A0AAD7WD00_9TELE|nr:hypothetical protein AAFF_G00083500 [Aldrovandia affinis]
MSSRGPPGALQRCSGGARLLMQGLLLGEESCVSGVRSLYSEKRGGEDRASDEGPPRCAASSGPAWPGTVGPAPQPEPRTKGPLREEGGRSGCSSGAGLGSALC